MFTIIISSVALLFSFISIYFQFFRKKTAILCKLLGIDYDVPNNRYDRLLKYSISNLGNKEILINDIEFLSGRTSLGRAKDSYSIHKYECKNYPVVLKPGEIKIIEISTRFFVEIPKNEKSTKYFIMFEFVSINGKIKEILHDITSLNDTLVKDEKVWKPFTLKNVAKD